MRKIITLLAFLLMFISGTEAQLGGTHNYLDSSYISPRDLTQQSDFLNNNSNFPAKPRDMWQLGVFIGYPYIDGDCPTAFHGLGSGITSYAWGGGASLRKSIGYVVSLRASLAYFNMVGLQYQKNGNLNNNRVVQANYQTAPGYYVHNYHSTAGVASIEALISLNNIMFHNRQGKYNLYALGGYTAFAYKTKMDVLKADGGRYLFETVNYNRPRKEIVADLRKLFDNKFETDAAFNDRTPSIGEFKLRHSLSIGAGLEYRVGKMTSLSVEYKRIQTRDDYVDGWQYQSGDLLHATHTSEWDNVGFLSFGVNQNLGNSSKRIPPLWWMNPLEFAYSELNNPKHMKLPKVKLDDADGDGVTDQFDLEPNTPPGAPVDTHGVSKDTDGDGVPDYRDKELITLQNCFPVDEDGVGNCPEPECCKRIDTCCKGKPPVSECTITDLPSIQFKGGSVKLSKEAMSILSVVAGKLKAQPSCKVKVSGHGPATKPAQQLSWDRVDAVIRYLVEKQGISSNRVIFEYGTAGDPNTVDLMGTTEEGPNRVDQPHPQFHKTR